MLKSPPNFLSKSRLLWNKVSVAPLPPRTMLQQTFSIFNRQFRWQSAQHTTPNQHCPGERGFASTVLSKIVDSPIRKTFDQRLVSLLCRNEGTAGGQIGEKINPYWSTSIHIDPQRSTSIHIDPHRSRSIHIHPQRSTSIHIDPYRISIHSDPHQPISHIDPDRSILIRIDPHRSTSIHIAYRSTSTHSDPHQSISHIDRSVDGWIDRCIDIWIDK